VWRNRNALQVENDHRDRREFPTRRWRYPSFARSGQAASLRSEVNVKDRAGYEANFLKSTKTDISQHGGKYLAVGYDKTLSLVGAEPPNRVILLQFPNMDAVNEWRKQGEEDMENTVGGKYATFRIYAVEGIAQ
jgi:uncharacterized protein (DUF1330 family)